jgi:hypothetical protein
MAGFKKADKSAIKRYTMPGSSDWIDLRLELSVGDRHRLQELMRTYVSNDSADEETTGVKVNTSSYQKALFEMLAVAWSYADGVPDPQDYISLDDESGSWVDQKMDEALVERRKRMAAGKERGSSPKTTRVRRTRVEVSASKTNQT